MLGRRAWPAGRLAALGASPHARAGFSWIHCYVTDDNIYCIYQAPDEAMVREHARQGGFPANSVARVHAIIDPATAE
jgi:hypothetical protein